MSYLSPRNFGCRITEVSIQGMAAVYLENEVVRIGVLMDKGTGIFEFLHKPTDTDFMVRAPFGLRNPALFTPARSSSRGNFIDFWEGGWPEMFPSAGNPCVYKRAEIGSHGDVYLQPWQWRVERDDEGEIQVAAEVLSSRLPLRLQKRLTLRRGRGVLDIWERVTNEGGMPIDFLWGHHPTFGGAFIGPACVIDVPPCQVEVAGPPADESARLRPGSGYAWPLVPGMDGNMIDISLVPPRSAGSHDMTALSGLAEGWYGITNTERGVGFGMHWDISLFRWLWFWQLYGGAPNWPWFRRWYTCALEPCSTFPGDLAEAAPRGQALHLEAGASLETSLLAVAYQGRERVRGIDEQGYVRRQE